MGESASQKLRWKLADDDGGQPGLFDAVERVPGTRELAGLEFLHVHARRVINRVPEASRMPFRYTINTYRGCSHACVYCFARPTHEYLNLNRGVDFDTKIVVKVNAVERVRAELAAPGWHGELIALGTNTDPYQPCEGRYRLTRGVLEALADVANPVSIVTKSPLIERDIDVLHAAARAAAVRVDISIGCLDREIAHRVEPHVASPQRRLKTVAALADAGIPVGVFIAPVLPGISDAPQQLEELARACVDSGAESLSTSILHLRPGVREHFLEWLTDAYPHLVSEYLHRFRGPYLPSNERRVLSSTVQETAAAHRSLTQRGLRRRSRPTPQAATRPAEPPDTPQLTLL